MSAPAPLPPMRGAYQLDDIQKQRLAEVLAQGGMPRLFWPGVQRLVEDLCAQAQLQREGDLAGRIAATSKAYP